MEPSLNTEFRSVVPWLQSVIVGLLLVFLGYIYVNFYLRLPQNSDQEENRTKKSEEMAGGQKPERKVTAPITVTKVSKKKPQVDKWSRHDSKHTFSHEWLLTSLKGHTGSILDLDFSANGKFLATCAEDRAIFVWNTKDWKERDHKFLRYNVDLDHASLIKWSPDTKAVVFRRHTDNIIEVCKVVRKSDGWISAVSKTHTYQNLHKDSTIGLGIDVNGRYIMSCSSGTEIALIDIKGTELTRFDTYLMNNYAAKVSPCGKFVAASGFAPDVKVWEVQFTKGGEFKQVARAFELTGHSSGVYDFAFNADSTMIATISKDGSWRLFNIKIEFDKGEEPRLLKTGKYKTEGGSSASLALSPSGDVIVLASASSITFINAITGTTDKIISDIYPGQVTKVCFDSAGQYLLTAGDKHIRVFHNVTGRRAAILSAKEKLSAPGVSSATKERLQDIISASEAFLANYSS